MAALQFLSKYRETGLLLFRVSIGLIIIYLIAPVLWNGQGSWEHFGSAMRHLDFHSHYKFWGFVGAVAGCAGGVLMILGLFFRVGVLMVLAVTLVHLIALWDRNAAIVPQSNHVLTFGGAAKTTVPAGAILVSDAVEFTARD